MDDKLYFSYNDLQKIIADKDILQKVMESMDETTRYWFEMLSKLSGALGKQVVDLDWDPFDGWRYYDGKQWHELPSRFRKMVEELSKQYMRISETVYKFKLVLQELLWIKYETRYICYYIDPEKKYECIREVNR